MTIYTLFSWNRDASLLRTFFLLHDREIFASLVDTSTSCDTRAKLSNASRSLCASDFSSNNNVNSFWNTRAKLIDVFRLLCVNEFLSNDNANLFYNIDNNLVFNDEISS